MTRPEKILSGVGIVVLLWLAGYHGTATLVLVAVAAVWWFDAVFFDEEKCWCDGGKVRSPLTRTWRRHRKCGGTGVRQRRSRRLLDRRMK